MCALRSILCCGGRVELLTCPDCTPHAQLRKNAQKNIAFDTSPFVSYVAAKQKLQVKTEARKSAWRFTLKDLYRYSLYTCCYTGGRDKVLPSYKAAISALFRIRTNSCWQNFIGRKTQGRFGSISVMSICRCAVAFDLRIASPNTCEAL